MSCFVIVRGATDTVQACAEIADFFVFRQRRNPQRVPEVLAFWLDPHMVFEPPRALALNDSPTDPPTIPTQETVTTSGLGTACRLEPFASKDGDVSRKVLQEALLEASRHEQQNGRLRRSIPGFGMNPPAPKVQAEMDGLLKEFPSQLRPEAYQDLATGRLVPQARQRTNPEE